MSITVTVESWGGGAGPESSDAPALVITTMLSCYVTPPACLGLWVCQLPFEEDPQAHSHSLPPPSLASTGQDKVISWVSTVPWGPVGKLWTNELS